MCTGTQQRKRNVRDPELLKLEDEICPTQVTSMHPIYKRNLDYYATQSILPLSRLLPLQSFATSGPILSERPPTCDLLASEPDRIRH